MADKLTTEQVLNFIRTKKDVEYYNKEIIKRKQRNNKEYNIEEIEASSSSFDLVAYAPQINQEVVLAEILSEGESQEKEKESPDSTLELIQAPTSSNDLIKPTHIKRAMIQYYQNENGTRAQKHKLKVRLNCDFGDGAENIEFIAALTQDLGNFKKYHPEESRDFIQEWVDDSRKKIKANLEVKPHLGKFHNNSGWKKTGQQVNQIEPWTACLLWYNKATRKYNCLVRIYAWEELFELDTESMTDKQIKTNMKSQKLWYNPEHLNLVRPKTWAQKRFGDKK